MKKFTFILTGLLLFVLPVTSWAAGKAVKTTLNCRLYGFRAETLYVDCINDPQIRKEFAPNPGEDLTLTFTTDRMMVFTVFETEVMVEPGDSLCVDIRYGSQSRRPESVEFTGSPKSVIENQIFQSLENFRLAMKYRDRLLSCAVLGVTPAERFADSEKMLQRVNETLARNKKKVSKAFANYTGAYYDALYWMSKLEYPVMYAALCRTPIEEQGIGDYWTIDKGLKIRKDEASLSCFPYYELILRYCNYCYERKAAAKGETYERPDQLEEAYEQLASFYKGSVRDAALYALLGNYIRQGQQIERADNLMPDYLKNYNQNKQYAATLNALMQ